MTDRILVTGSRYWRKQDLLYSTLDRVEEQLTMESFRARPGERLDIVVVHGACPCRECRRFPCHCDSFGSTVGADVLAHRWAQLRGHHVTRYPADWNTHGNAAGPIRNSAMVAIKPRICVAFWLKGVRGTRDCVEKAVAHGVTTLIVPDRI